MFGVFGIWLLASAIVMLARARKGRAAIPEGFVSGAVIACLSLALVALILIDPLGTGVLLMIIIGVLVITLVLHSSSMG